MADNGRRANGSIGEQAYEGETSVETDDKKNTTTSTMARSKRNAFAELMSSKPFKAVKTSSDPTSTPKAAEAPQKHSRPSNDPRAGLLAYIQNPTSFPQNIVLRVTDHTVLIRDLYPKATIHLLMLPRSPAHYDLHPHEAFNDLEFLALMKREATTAVDLAASELSRLISPYSTICRDRNEAMDAADPPQNLPPGRDFHKDLHVGIHAHPSMNHLHIHIFSRDMHSPALKHRKHYNSFNTDFFIPLADYPLTADDQRRGVTYQNANLSRDFVCWRCGRGFGNKFSKLKEHLEQEYRVWRAA